MIRGFRYYQASGLLTQVEPDGEWRVWLGYAGKGVGLNNPAMQHVKNVGPLPVGKYTMLAPRLDGGNLGPYVIPLQPDPSNDMHGRSGFYIHGNSLFDRDQNGKLDDASHGCLIFPRMVREQLGDAISEGISDLEVLSGTEPSSSAIDSAASAGRTPEAGYPEVGR